MDAKTLNTIAKTERMKRGGPPTDEFGNQTVGFYSDAGTQGYAGEPPAPVPQRGGPMLGDMFGAMQGNQAGLGWMQDAAMRTGHKMQRDALAAEQPERGQSGWKEQLLAAAVGMALNALERGSGKGFVEGFQHAESSRIEDEFRKKIDKAEKDKQIRLMEAQHKLQEAQGYGERRREMRDDQRFHQSMGHDIQMQELRNKGMSEKTASGSDAKILQAIISTPDNVQRLTALELAFRRGIISKDDYDVVKATAGQATSAEGLADERAATVKATRAGQVRELIAKGDLLGAQKVLTQAKASLTKVQAAWYPKEASARILKLNNDAALSLKKANDLAAGVLASGTKGAVTATSYFNAMKEISGAQAKVGALMAQLDANDAILQVKLSELQSPGAKPSDPLKPLTSEIAEIEEQLDANQALRAGYMEMSKRQNQRIEMLQGLAQQGMVQQDGYETKADQKAGRGPLDLAGQLHGPIGGMVSGMKNSLAAGAGTAGRGLKKGQSTTIGSVKIERER